jgi:hypothetical protein
MSLPEFNQQTAATSALVGLVDIEGFCGGPTMVFKNEPDEDGRRKTLTRPSLDGPAAQKAAVFDLSESLSQLYEQALKLGHTEAALFIGCASLSISETIAVEAVNAGARNATQSLSQKVCCED